jgi:altronate hydrolase
MRDSIVQVHPKDNVLVALSDLPKGKKVLYGGKEYLLAEDIPAKHKFTMQNISTGDAVYMYGVLVGRAKENIGMGSRISTANLKHASDEYKLSPVRKTGWHEPDVSSWQNKTFMGYHRTDGSVGTANYWLIVPLVFCENRNVEVMKEALLDELGYGRQKKYKEFTKLMVETYKSGAPIDHLEFKGEASQTHPRRIFENVDGIKFISHEGGCGGTRQDAQSLCGLLAGYITHPNVGGATVLSLGCQNAQVSMLMDEINKRIPNLDKPLFVLEQQKIGLETDLMGMALKQTFEGLATINKLTRKPAHLCKLNLGLECGGSDGFSGLSANPAIGFTSDLLVKLGGTVILSEFPELCGVEQEMSDRCVDEPTATRFINLMRTYNERAMAVGSGFDMNPSPGNIRDGLITDAIKSAGAAKKGGTSPVTDVLDYPERSKRPGLNLLCTPGSDVESTTAEVGAGANLVLFTTGLGTPTGNPIAPVIKISSNSTLYRRMPDIIDINAGTIIDGEETIEECGSRILDFVIQAASGQVPVHAVRHGQDDFIPWKRGVSL